MNLTKKQIEGIKISKERYVNKEIYTCISGFAGSGKSTLVKYLIEELEVDEDKITYATFTGKASLVLQQKGHPAQTLHKLLYNSFLNEKTGRFIHAPKKIGELSEYEIVIVDEVSMVPKKIWDLLLTHGVHVIALGDPFQLPPVGKDQDNGVLSNPHVFLDEVMRQALESDIIKVSMDIRNGWKLQPLNGNDVKVVRKADVVSGMYEWADQILCGLNSTRQNINRYMRGLKGITDIYPVEGDKVICLRNYWEDLTTSGMPLINGMIGQVLAVDSSEKTIGMTFSPEFDDSTADILKIDKNIFEKGQPTPYNRSTKEILTEFDYGHAITVWKAQGSQFDKVLFFAERNSHMSDEEYAKYVYTGITRAVSRVVIVI